MILNKTKTIDYKRLLRGCDLNFGKFSLAALLMMSVAACGDTTKRQPIYVPPPPPPPVTTPAEFRTDEFNLNWGLAAIGAEYAYAEGYTGEGQIIGVVDFNFDLASTYLDYHSNSLDLVPANVAIYEAQFLDAEPASTDPHGLAVAAAAAALKDDDGMHGVAFDAKVLAVDYFSGVYNQDITQGGVLYHQSDPYSYLMDNGVRVVNTSFGYDEGGTGLDPSVVEAYVTSNSAIVIERGGLLVAAAGNNADDEDNPNNGLEPQLSNLSIRDDADQYGLLVNGPGAFIIVGSVDENNVISSFSDRAGAFDPTATTQTMDIYLVAPGQGLFLPWDGEKGKGIYSPFAGTSFAAPHVTGAAAILFQRWPTLTAKEVAEILFTTATDLGDPGTDAIYGRGMLNLKEAISPQGQIVVNMVGSVSPIAIDNFALVVGAPFGDGTPIGLSSVMGLDKFGRDFYFDLSGGVYSLASSKQPARNFMDSNNKIKFNQWQAGGKTLGLQVFQEFSDGFLDTQSQLVKDTSKETRIVSGFAEGKLTKNWGWKMGIGAGLQAPLATNTSTAQLMSMQGQDGYLSSSGNFGLLEHNLDENTNVSFGFDIASNQGLSWHGSELIQEDLPRYSFAMQINQQVNSASFGVRVGQMLEKQSVLGSRSFDGFAVADSAATSFVGIDGSWNITNRFAISASIEAGVTNVSEASGSFFESFNSFASSAWQFQFEAKDLGFKNSNFVISASQPLRVENAYLTRHQAVGIDANRAPVYEQVTSPFSPTGREVAVEAAYVIDGANWSLQASVMQRFDAGHSQGVDDTAGVLWLKRRF